MAKNTEQETLKDMLERHGRESEYVRKLNVHVGNSDHEQTIAEAAKLGKKVLFVTGSKAMRRLRFVDRYMQLFNEAGVEARHFDNISPNPTLKQMEEGIAITKEFGPDFMFALGGGSVIDTAKIISAGLYGDIWDFVEKRESIKHAVPIVASATTSGTGSHVTPYAVVTNTDTLEKKTLKSDLLLPKMSVADVDITQHMPGPIQASTGFDVLCHAAEVYTRKDCTPMAAEFCERSLELVREHLVASYHNDSPENRLGMIYADIYAGIALALIGTHVPHAISHPISALFDKTSHGQALAYVFAETSRVQMEKGDDQLREKFKHMSELLGGSSDFVRTINNYVKLLDLGLERPFDPRDSERVHTDTVKYRWASVDRSPAGLTELDVSQIVHKCLDNPYTG